MENFVFFFRSEEAQAREAMGSPEQAQRSVQAMLDWVERLEAEGHLVDQGLPLERTGRVVAGPGAVVTDGPYAEAKDIVLGFLVVRARDLDAAVTLASECPMVLGGAMVEVRPVTSHGM